MPEVRRVKISEICEIEKGSIGLAKAKPGKYPLVTTGAECKTSESYQFEAKAVCIPLVSSTGHGKKSLNYVHYQEGRFALGTILAAVIPKDDKVLSARYLHAYLQKNKDRVLVPLMKGAANVSLSVKAISGVEIPLPSLRDQEKTLAKIDGISSEFEDFTKESNAQTNLFNQLRQAVLQEAIEGKLTTEWRKQNSKLITGENHASKLLEQIRVEKDRLIKDGTLRKEKPLPTITDNEKLVPLPEGWAWCRLGQLMTIRGGKRIPSGYTFANSVTPHVYIRIVDMKDGTILASDNKYVTEDVFQRISRYIIKSTDVYVTIAGTIGQSGLVPEEFDGMNLTENAARLTPYLIDKHWYHYSLSSQLIQSQFRESTKGMAQPKLALMRIAKTLCPLPPLSEQRAIVERVEKIMNMIGNLDQQTMERNRQSETLMRAVLREAFEHSHA